MARLRGACEEDEDAKNESVYGFDVAASAVNASTSVSLLLLSYAVPTFMPWKSSSEKE